MTTDFALILLIGVFVIGAAMKNISWLWFLSGVTCWALGVWWVINPVVDGSSPMNDILVVITFIGGVGLMFMISWQNRTVNGRETGGINIRLPRFLGGQSEDEEMETRRRGSLTSKDRQSAYDERLGNILRRRR